MEQKIIGGRCDKPYTRNVTKTTKRNFTKRNFTPTSKGRYATRQYFIQEVKRYSEMGLVDTEVARLCGCSPHTISMIKIKRY